MRSYPEDSEWDRKDLARLNALPWMIELLRLNPDYPHWGPHEDYMCTKGDGWNSAVKHETWSAFGPWNLDDMNECVHFYFEVSRASHNCDHCDGQAVNPATMKIANDFYDFDGTGRRWCDAITQDELDALNEEGRNREGHDLATVNAANGPHAPRGPKTFFATHDAINRWILIKARAQRLGVYGPCEHCDEGTIWDANEAHVSLVLWWLHPRKGASRGVEIERIEQSELPAVYAFLSAAAKRNADRFARVVEALGTTTDEVEAESEDVA